MKTSLAGFGREKAMIWRHHDAIARALVPGGLDKIPQARFSAAHGMFPGLQSEDYI